MNLCFTAQCFFQHATKKVDCTSFFVRQRENLKQLKLIIHSLSQVMCDRWVLKTLRGPGFIFCPLSSQTVLNLIQHHRLHIYLKPYVKTPIMSEVPPAERIPLRFLYMCMHSISGYFRKRDGRPFNVSDLESPHDPEVTWESFGDAHVDPQIRPQLRVCYQCRRRRAQRLERFRQLYQRGSGSGVTDLGFLRMEEMRRIDDAEDVRLMERALGHNIRGVQERLETQLIGATPLADNNGNNLQQRQPQRQNLAWWGGTISSAPFP